MAENEEKNGGVNIPPKLVIKPQGGAAGPAGSASPTQGVPPPGTVRMRVPSPSAAPRDDPKKATAKIPLSEAVSGPAAGAGVKTIRLKPATPPPPTLAAPLSRTGSITPPATPPSTAAETAEKRKTSRISLEAVLGSEGEEAGGDDRVPKTIRLKKPSEMATVKVGQSAPVTPVKGDTTTIAEEKSEPKKSTQPIPPVAEAEEAGTSRRRTIRVKRPAGGGRVELGEGGEERPAAGIARAEELEGVEDRPHGFFIFSAVAAMLVTMVLIYVLTAQAFGPNSCLTQLSYGAPGLDLAWPGKMTITGGR